MNNKTIVSVLTKGLCTGCGTCVGICPKDAVEMVIDHRQGLYVPRLDEEKCNECGLCFQVCPGHAVDFKQLNLDIFGIEPDDIIMGNHLNCYLGHASDYDIRYDSASGGLVTALLVFALEQGLIDGALVTRMRKDKPLEPEPFIAKTREEIISASKSKYCPVPANIALKEIIKSKDCEKFAVVGLPCHIHGVRKAEKVNRTLKERIVLHLGIVCSHSDRFTETHFLMHKYGIDKKEVIQLDYRGQGWPGSMRIQLRDAAGKYIPYDEYIALHELYLFTPPRCTLCCDMVARLADASFMDAWLPEIKVRDNAGSSIVISRTEKSETLGQRAILENAVELKEISSTDALRSQGKTRISNKDLKANFYLSRLRGNAIPNYNIAIPKSGPANYLRAIVVNFNIWLSSQIFLGKLINPLAYVESRAFRQIKSKI